MPQIQRSNLPEALFRHLLQRVKEREISVSDIAQLAGWLDTQPEVPEGRWFRRFETFAVCGEGALIKTFLGKNQSATGTEV